MITFTKETVQDPGSDDGLGKAKDASGIKEDTLQLLQEQVEHEFFAERLYLSIAVWLDDQGYPETAKFFSEHALEERGHAMKFLNFILKRGEKTIVPATKEPPNTFENVGEVFETTLDHERFITEKVTKIYTTSLEEGDIMSADIARTFLTEQVEEEQKFLSLYNMYKLEDRIDVGMEAQICAFKQGNHITGNL